MGGGAGEVESVARVEEGVREQVGTSGGGAPEGAPPPVMVLAAEGKVGEYDANLGLRKVGGEE